MSPREGADGCAPARVTESAAAALAKRAASSKGIPLDSAAATAAGDVFNGALAAALSRGMPLLEAARFANAAAALSVTRAGAQPSAPGREDILAFWEEGG